MTEQELDAVLDALDEEFRALPPSPYRDYLIRWAKGQGRKAGRPEGANLGERRVLLAMGSRLFSPEELELLGALTLERLREEVEGRIAHLAIQQPQGYGAQTSAVRDALMGNLERQKVTMSDDAMNASDEWACAPHFFRFHNYLTPWATREGLREGRQEGERRGERRALLAIGSRLMSPDAFQRLRRLRLEKLRREVEGRINALAGQQPQG
jgi:hypothetical protein